MRQLLFPSCLVAATAVLVLWIWAGSWSWAMDDGSTVRIDASHSRLALTCDSMRGDGFWFPILHVGDQFYLMTKGGSAWSGKVTSACVPDWFLFLIFLLYPITNVCLQWRKRRAGTRGFPLTTQTSVRA